MDTNEDEKAIIGSGQTSNETAEIADIAGIDEFLHRLTLPKPNTADRVAFFQGLSKCFDRNVPTIKSFQLQTNRVKSPRYRGVIAEICADLQTGERISDAMAKHEDVFTNDMVALVRAGEESGQLPTVFTRIGNSQKKTLSIVRKLRSGMIYPAIVLTLGIGVVIAMAFTLIPAMEKLYSSLDAKLPMATVMLMHLSDFLIAYPWAAAIPFFGLFMFFRSWGKIKQNKGVQQLFIKMPVVGNIVRKSAAATSFRCLALLVEANVRIGTALQITSESAPHYYYKTFFNRVYEHIAVGRTLPESFLLEGHWLGDDSRTICGVMEIAGETGTGAEPLNEIADDYEEELDVIANQIDKVIEPITIIVLGSLVAFLIYAIYSPIFSLGDALLFKK
ncbi:MAG: type II secretion system F family protein [Verrucomicrobiota bacterium]